MAGGKDSMSTSEINWILVLLNLVQAVTEVNKEYTSAKVLQQDQIPQP